MRYREPPRLARAPPRHDLEIDLLGLRLSLVVRRYEHVGGCPYRVISGMDRSNAKRSILCSPRAAQAATSPENTRSGCGGQSGVLLAGLCAAR